MGTETNDTLDPRIARSRAKMLAAATELLIEHGPRAVTVDAIVERSGVAKSTLYRHWSSAVDLLVEVMRSNMPATPESLDDLPFMDALRSLVASLAESVCQPEWLRVMPAIISMQSQIPEMAELIAEEKRSREEAVAAILERGIAEGVIDPGVDVERVVLFLGGPFVLAGLTGSPLVGDDAVDQVVEMVVQVFGPRSGRSRVSRG